MIPRTLCVLVLLLATRAALAEPVSVSGIYPHLAAFNGHGECGIGAVVPWAGKLWYITYPPHMRTGSNDKLHEVGDDMTLTIRPESVGGTHANRFIHEPSQQLIIGPYFIDAKGNVRAADVKKQLIGRMTATCAHLTDPANKVYFVDMEGPVYEVDVKTLEARRIFVKPAPGWHGKGAYTAQGRLIISNNGEGSAAGDLKGLPWESDMKKWSKGPEDAGVLAEYDGTKWSIIQRRQFTDITGPGGIRGEPVGEDGKPVKDTPVWAMGWDKRSVMLLVRHEDKWHTYRLPKASYTFDPKHGWYTEWPRIREIAPAVKRAPGSPMPSEPPQYMAVMHGMMWAFPENFSPKSATGPLPFASHLRYIPDFCHWNGRIVLAADDTSIMQNKLAGQSQSNLQFIEQGELTAFGPKAGWGGVWVGDHVKAGEASDPFIFLGPGQHGFHHRVLHLSHQANADVTFTLEVDVQGNGQWRELRKITVPAKSAAFHIFAEAESAWWVRIKPDRDCQVTAYFHYNSQRKPLPRYAASPFDGLAKVDEKQAWTGGLVRPAGHNCNLQFLARGVSGEGKAGDEVYYEVNEKLQFERAESAQRVKEVHDVADIASPDFEVDAASVIVKGKDGKRYRLPKGETVFDKAGPLGWPRGIREVASERYLANFHGSFYEIPRAEGAGTHTPDFSRMKPVATHNRAITDYCSWRGLLVIAGTHKSAKAEGHYFAAGDGGPGLWLGAIDDLWNFGKPSGQGGPWKDTAVKAKEPSDAYLMTNYDSKEIALSHDANEDVTVTIEIDFLATGIWRKYRDVKVPAGETVTHKFPQGLGAHWVRVTADRDCKATAWLTYE